jgi:hypothetical protein
MRGNLPRNGSRANMDEKQGGGKMEHQTTAPTVDQTHKLWNLQTMVDRAGRILCKGVETAFPVGSLVLVNTHRYKGTIGRVVRHDFGPGDDAGCLSLTPLNRGPAALDIPAHWTELTICEDEVGG